MNYCAPFRTNDIANGLGVRCSLFVTGCRIHCPNCFNKDCQSFDYGQPFTEADQEAFLKAMEPDWIAGATILGGEPMEPENQAGILPLLRAIREKFGNKKNIWLYTGYVLEEDLLPGGRKYVEGTTAEILSLVDTLVDGPFVEAKKDPSLAFRGSSNQRIIDMMGWRSKHGN